MILSPSFTVTNCLLLKMTINNPSINLYSHVVSNAETPATFPPLLLPVHYKTMLCLENLRSVKIRGCIDVDVRGHKNMSPEHVHERHEKGGGGKEEKGKTPPPKKDISSHKWSILNPLLPHISMHILHTVLSTFPRLLTRRICSAIKGFFSWWSCPLFSWP